MRRPLSLLLLLPALLLPAARAHAQADPAADHYRAGVTHFKAGQYPEAIVEFRAADALRPSPALSFNIAQCYEKMADLANAKGSYQEYLRRAPQAEDRKAVESTIASIEAKLAQNQRENTVLVVPSEATAPATETALAVSPSHGSPNYALAATLAGVGVAGLVAGVVLNLVSQQASQSLQNNGARGSNGQPNFYSASQAQTFHDNAQTYWIGALIGYIAGGALAASGVVVGGVELAGAR